MRNTVMTIAVLASAFAITGCGESAKDEVPDKKIVGVLDESNLNDIMLTVADPEEAVTYFQSALAKDPNRLDMQRGLAKSLVRAKRGPEAVIAYRKVMKSDKSTDQDRVDYASALIRTNDWKGAKAQLNLVPPTMETFQRYRLEAMIADSEKNWAKADSFYETAIGLTTQPANVLNNWGFSKLNRGKPLEAEKLFLEAITYDPKLFTAKNNLVLARTSRNEYSLPAIPMTAEERAQLLYTAGLSALKQGNSDLARGLMGEAIDTHPRHFAEAVRSLRSLDKTVSR